MEIKGFIGLSLIDWDGRVSSVIFLPGCNLRCPFCYNTKIVLHPDEMSTISFDQISNYLIKNKGWIDGVVITGGEPTLQEDLPSLCEEIQKLGLSVKIDTNGTNPNMMRKLIDKRSVGYVAMDVKAPLTENAYSKASGVNIANLLRKVQETIGILIENKVDYEFRTTLVPGIHKVDDIGEICERLKGCKKYVLQNFKANVETIDPNFRNLQPLSTAESESILKAARNILPYTILRS